MSPLPTRSSSAYTSDEQRWRALCERDTAADGAFYYGVVSTGVYCYPSCPSRRARRDNVRFYRTQEQAELAGFRPCRRCRPEQPVPTLQRADLIERACRLLESDEAPGVAEVARRLGVSRYHLPRRFKAATGLSPKAYQLAARRQRLAETVRSLPRVTDASVSGGFESATRFYHDTGERLGMRPSSLRRDAAGELIRFSFADTVFGRIVVAWTDAGICTIAFGNDDASLRSLLEERYARARLVKDAGAGADLVQHVVRHIEDPTASSALPVDIRGTVFQEQVWQALQRIPVGETRSYTEVARRIGRPGATRAVARACAANPVAICVPCHRVVRADGSLGGYRWGIELKRALLVHERGTAVDGERDCCSAHRSDS